jgi:hypothetical protein
MSEIGMIRWVVGSWRFRFGQNLNIVDCILRVCMLL